MSNWNICGVCQREFKVNRNGICVAFYRNTTSDENEGQLKEYLALHMADEWICPGCQTTLLVTNTNACCYPDREHSNEMEYRMEEYRKQNKLVEVLVR